MRTDHGFFYQTPHIDMHVLKLKSRTNIFAHCTDVGCEESGFLFRGPRFFLQAGEKDPDDPVGTVIVSTPCLSTLNSEIPFFEFLVFFTGSFITNYPPTLILRKVPARGRSLNFSTYSCIPSLCSHHIF